nr:hypothetical protein [uncultured bacterium]
MFRIMVYMTQNMVVCVVGNGGIVRPSGSAGKPLTCACF